MRKRLRQPEGGELKQSADPLATVGCAPSWLTPATLAQSDECLALDFVSELLLRAAKQHGIPVSDVTEHGATNALRKMAEGMAGGLQTSALEKVLRCSLRGDLVGAGQLIRDMAIDGVNRVRTNRLANLGANRKRQLSDFAKKGNVARRKYTDSDKRRWRARGASLSPRLSKQGKAQRIAELEGLPRQAVETIRRVID